jgi:hypothetical protein
LANCPPAKCELPKRDEGFARNDEPRFEFPRPPLKYELFVHDELPRVDTLPSMDCRPLDGRSELKRSTRRRVLRGVRPPRDALATFDCGWLQGGRFASIDRLALAAPNDLFALAEVR